MRLFRRPTSIDVYDPITHTWARPIASRSAKRVPVLHIVLFATTFVTTSMAGAYQSGVDPLADFNNLRAGFPFAITLMTILLFHELGHYTLSRVHGVRATLPYFIPAPPFLVGTFGAFIRMKSPPRTRRALFDVGAAGPWAGFVLAIPAVVVGLRLSEVRSLGPGEGGLILGDSIIFSLLSRLALGVNPSEATILLHPIALAGWFGLFVTFLNLLPMGQLDGGHVAYSMFGPRHRWVARLFLVVILFLGLRGWEGWFFWAMLVTVLGLDHPPTMDWWTPLDGRRRLFAWLTVGMFVLTFIPEPLTFSEARPEFEGEKVPVAARIGEQRRRTWRVVIGGRRGQPASHSAAARGVAL
jgi:membrane-associated protease RseP (regulator of RpoE activity)